MVAEENAFITQMAISSANYLANGSIGILVGCGIVYKTVGWRVSVDNFKLREDDTL